MSTARQSRGGDRNSVNNNNQWDGLASQPGGGIGNTGSSSVKPSVGGGKPQLLRCVTTLTLSVVCALDGKSLLIDKNIHGPNSFRVGNALISSDDG